MGQAEYSDEVLEEAPGKVTDFLLGVGADPAIRTILAGIGFEDDDIEEGTALLLASFGKKKSIDKDTDSAKAQREAVAALSSMDEDIFPRAKATLERFDPNAGEFLLQGLSVQESANDSVTALAAFCANYRIVEKGRQGREKQDQQAIERLTKRKIGPDKIAEIEQLIAKALAPTEVKIEGDKETRKAALLALKKWHDEWSSSARSVIKKRGQLIRLGLAKRKRPAKKTT